MANYGVWGIGSNISKTIQQSGMMSFLKGWHYSFKWSELEPSPGVFNWEWFDSVMLNAANLNLDISYMVWTGNWTPDWLYQAPFSVPKCAIDTSSSGQPDIKPSAIMYFPYYYNGLYKTRFRNMIETVIDHVATLPESVLSKLRYQQICEGTTGDEGPWHGHIIGATIEGVPQDDYMKYDLEENGDAEWDTFKKGIWEFTYAAIKEKVPTMEMMINPANNGTNWDFAEASYPTAYLKHGDYSHNFAFAGDDYYGDYVRKRAAQGVLNRAEIALENVMMNWNRLNACPQALFAMVACALNAGMNTINQTYQNYIYLKTPDNFSYEFFNEYAEPTTPGGTLRKGFALLRLQIDIGDIDLYPEEEYGVLIDPLQKKSYDNIVRLINSDPNRSEGQKLTGTTNQKVKKINQSRVNALRAVHEQYGLQYNGLTNTRDEDHWSYDYSIDTTSGPYKRYINLLNQFGSTYPVMRIGNPMVDQIGRYGLSTKTEMFFDTTSEGLTSVGNNHVTFEIYYWNEGIGTIRVLYHNGTRKNFGKGITTSNTKQFLTSKFIITDYKGGNRLPNGADFSIKKISGNDVTVSLIKMSAISAAPTGEEQDCGEEPCEGVIPCDDNGNSEGITINLNIDHLTVNICSEEIEPEYDVNK